MHYKKIIANFLQKIFSIKNLYIENIKKKVIYIFGIKITFKTKFDRLRFDWQDAFNDYFMKNNMDKKYDKLKENLDDISIEYVDKFRELTKYWDKYVSKSKVWTNEDKRTDKVYKEFIITFKQPFPDILTINPYLYSNIYGLADLPREVLDSIDGKIIIDGGGLNGDTALMFNHYFPNSEIHVFEPLSININKIKQFLSIDNKNNKIIPIQKGLGDKEECIEITFNDKEMADITTIDNCYLKDNRKIGLIKLDTEGFESLIIKGGLEVIKRDKPVLAIAIYHTPQDFFDLKQKIEDLNVGYKFRIRRSEMILPQADLVLIAY